MNRNYSSAVVPEAIKNDVTDLAVCLENNMWRDSLVICLMIETPYPEFRDQLSVKFSNHLILNLSSTVDAGVYFK